MKSKVKVTREDGRVEEVKVKTKVGEILRDIAVVALSVWEVIRLFVR